MFRANFVALIVISLGVFARADDAKKDADAHLGTWRQVLVVGDGKDIPTGSSTLATITREGYSITINGKPYQKGTSKSDRTKSPTETETKITEGEWAGGTVLGISKIEGDVMIQCIGSERPTEFKSKPGSGHTLMVWFRVK